MGRVLTSWSVSLALAASHEAAGRPLLIWSGLVDWWAAPGSVETLMRVHMSRNATEPDPDLGAAWSWAAEVLI